MRLRVVGRYKDRETQHGAEARRIGRRGERRGGEKEEPGKAILQIEILTDTRPTPHNRTQAAPHSVRPYFVGAIPWALGWVWASSAVVVRATPAAMEPRRALAPEEYTALDSACAAQRGCMPAEFVGVALAEVVVPVVVLGYWSIRRA